MNQWAARRTGGKTASIQIEFSFAARTKARVDRTAAAVAAGLSPFIRG